ncbi:2470_t:CDS:2, partial [Acaulospora colombiana]
QPSGAQTITPGDDNENKTFDERDSQIDSPYLDDDNHNRLVSEKIASLGTRASNGIVSTRRRQSSPTMWQQLLFTLAFVLVATILWLYKTDSALFGYCDTGLDTNEAVRQRLEEIQAEKACQEIVIKRAEAGLPVDPELEKCKAPFLPRATSCTPCPAHAVCSGRSIECEPAYIKTPSIISSIPFMDAALDGMPGLGSVAFPPSVCPEREEAPARGNAQDAAAYGMTIDEIKPGLRNAVPKSELDNNGLLVSVRDIRGVVVSAAVVAVLVLILRSNLTKRALESRRVGKLVKEAIERVREQEARHYLDPSGYPSATISSLHLRDELLQDEHSLTKRARLWEQVEKVVEVNSNVRSNMEVTSTGDEGRVWTWVGAGGGRTKLLEGNGTGRPLI